MGEFNISYQVMKDMAMIFILLLFFYVYLKFLIELCSNTDCKTRIWKCENLYPKILSAFV